MARSRRRSLATNRSASRRRQPGLGIERLDARLALSANAELASRWLKFQAAAAVAPAAAPGPRIAPPTTTETVAAARIAAAAPLPSVTSVRSSNGGAAGSPGTPAGPPVPDYTVTVTGSNFVVDSSLAVNFSYKLNGNWTPLGGVTQASSTAWSATTTSITFAMADLYPQYTAALASFTPALPAGSPLICAVTVAGSNGGPPATDSSPTFVFVDVAEVQSLSYNGRTTNQSNGQPAAGQLAQNGPLGGGGTLVINGDFTPPGGSALADAVVQLRDSTGNVYTVPAGNIQSTTTSQITLTLPQLNVASSSAANKNWKPWTADTTVQVQVNYPVNGALVPSTAAVNGSGGFGNQFTLYANTYTTLEIKLRKEVVSQAPNGIYLVGYSQVGTANGKLVSVSPPYTAADEAWLPVVLQVTQQGTAGLNVGTWELGLSMIDTQTYTATGTQAAAGKPQTLTLPSGAFSGPNAVTLGMVVSDPSGTYLLPNNPANGNTIVKAIDSSNNTITISSRLLVSLPSGGASLTFTAPTVQQSKFDPLSFGPPDSNNVQTATIQVENLLYSTGQSNVSAGAVLSIGGFPNMAVDSTGLTGTPTIASNPGLLFGLTELNVSGLATTNFSAPSTVVDVSFVDQFGIPLQATTAPAAPYPLNPIGLATGQSRQGVITGFANFVKSLGPSASAFAPLLSSSPGGVVTNPSASPVSASTGTVQIAAPADYLGAVEQSSGIEPALTSTKVTGGTLQNPTVGAGQTGGYFYWVTAVGDGGGETQFFGVGQNAVSPNIDGYYNTAFQTVDTANKNNAIIVSWGAANQQIGVGPGSFPSQMQSTAVSYNVYRQAGYTIDGTATVPQPVSGTSIQKLTISIPGTSLSYLDNGQGTWVDAGPSYSNGTYSALSSFFNPSLNTFFTMYQAANSFVITRDGIVWKGQTVDPTNSGSGTSFTYKTGASSTSTKTAYGRALLLTSYGANGSTADTNNQVVWLDPSAGAANLIQNTWMANTDNFQLSAGYQIFAAAGAAANIGPADQASVPGVNVWADLGNSISAAFDRGLATNAGLKPLAWANPPLFSAAATVSSRSGTWTSGQLKPHTWAVTGVDANGTETVYGVVTTATPQSGKAVKLQWGTAPTGSLQYQSFNLYRAKGSPGQALSFKLVQGGIPASQAVNGTLTYHDKGGKLPALATQPVTYWAPGTVYDVYAAYQHRIAANGLAYGYAYDDQGAMSSTYTANGNPQTLTGYLNKLTVSGLRWGTVGNTNAKDGTKNSVATGISIAPIPSQIPVQTPSAGVPLFSVAQTTLAVQVMARDTSTNAVFPAVGTTNWTVRVANGTTLPSLAVGTKFPVSFLSGQAQVPLSGSAPVKGNTYTVALQLFNGNNKPVGSPQTVSFTTY